MNDDRTQVGETRLVLDIIRMTIHNGPGYRTLILFKGCPLRCAWCSTPESQKPEREIAVYPKKCLRCGQCLPLCPVGAIRLTEESFEIDRELCNRCGACADGCYAEAIKILGRPMGVDELLAEARKDEQFWKHTGGGITISGGEPLLRAEYARELLEACRNEGITVGVDTCGHVPWAGIEPLLANVDFFLWDIKHMDPDKHREYTGVSNRLILENARAASERGAAMYVRIPVIPGYNDAEENIRATCEFALTLPSLLELHLVPLHHLGKARYESLNLPYPLEGLPLIPEDVMQRMKRLVESYGLKAAIGG